MLLILVDPSNQNV
nr:unnamed protein product [Callosobruchus analis]